MDVFDYAQGYEVMLSMMDQLEVDAAQSGEPGHDTAEGWLQWCFDLRTRPEAIMYFGDQIEENQFRTADGQLHETLEAAQAHDRSRYAQLRMGGRRRRWDSGHRIRDLSFAAVCSNDREADGADLAALAFADATSVRVCGIFLFWGTADVSNPVIHGYRCSPDRQRSFAASGSSWDGWSTGQKLLLGRDQTFDGVGN